MNKPDTKDGLSDDLPYPAGHELDSVTGPLPKKCLCKGSKRHPDCPVHNPDGTLKTAELAPGACTACRQVGTHHPHCFHHPDKAESAPNWEILKYLYSEGFARWWLETAPEYTLESEKMTRRRLQRMCWEAWCAGRKEQILSMCEHQRTDNQGG